MTLYHSREALSLSQGNTCMIRMQSKIQLSLSAKVTSIWVSNREVNLKRRKEPRELQIRTNSHSLTLIKTELSSLAHPISTRFRSATARPRVTTSRSPICSKAAMLINQARGTTRRATLKLGQLLPRNLRTLDRVILLLAQIIAQCNRALLLCTSHLLLKP